MGVYPVQTQFMRMLASPVQAAPDGAVSDEYMGSTVRPVVKAAEEVMRLPNARIVRTVLRSDPYDCTNWLTAPLPEGQTDTFPYLEPRLVEWDYMVYDRENSRKFNGAGYPNPVYKDGTSKINRLAVTAPAERPVTVHVEFNTLASFTLNPAFEGDVSGINVVGVGLKWICVAGRDKHYAGVSGVSVAVGGGGTGSGVSAMSFGQFVVDPGCTYEFNIDAGLVTDQSAGGVGLASQPYLTKLLPDYETFETTPWKGFSKVEDDSFVNAPNSPFTSMTVITY